jgi:hypothetical protein
MPRAFTTVIAAAGFCLSAANAGAQGSAPGGGWNTGYQMGTFYAGVSAGATARFTFYCGDKAAARANPAITGGPYLTIGLPKAPGLDGARTADIVVDGKATRVPVKAEPNGDGVDLTWTPNGSFDAARMRPIVAALRKAKSLAVTAGGTTQAFATAKAADALRDDPLSCR